MRRRADLAGVVAGIGLMAFGAVALADRLGALDLGFEHVWPALLAITGVALLLGDRDRRR